jgi:hypothetical protein
VHGHVLLTDVIRRRLSRLRRREPVRASNTAEPRTVRETRFGGLVRAGVPAGQANTGLSKPGCGDCRLAQGLSRTAQDPGRRAPVGIERVNGFAEPADWGQTKPKSSAAKT